MTMVKVKLDKEKFNRIGKLIGEISKGEVMNVEGVYSPVVTKTEYKNLLNRYERTLSNNEKFMDDLTFRIDKIKTAIKRGNDFEVKRQLEMIQKAATKYL